MEFTPGYSLTGIVKDQAVMLTEHGHNVWIVVNEQFHGDTEGIPATIIKSLPFTHLKDYASLQDLSAEHVMVSEQTKAMYLDLHKNFDIDIIFTHDLVFTGWNLPYAVGTQKGGRHDDMNDVRWLHWIHSVPSRSSDWWNINSYGPNHRIVFPNRSHQRQVAEQYRGLEHQVEVIPHIKDLRSFFDFTPETWQFTREYPDIMSADVVQVYPASVDRLTAKRVAEVMLIFGKLKELGMSVCLVIANQWTTGTQQKEAVDRFKKIGSRNGLKIGKELIFTSDWQTPKYDVGLSREILRELMMFSNLFIFPTSEESFGLVVPELSLASGALLVLNKSLRCQIEITGQQALYFDFGSHEQAFHCDNMDQYLRDIAIIIKHRFQRNEALATRTFIRQRYNMNNIYNEYYLPILTSAGRVW